MRVTWEEWKTGPEKGTWSEWRTTLKGTKSTDMQICKVHRYHGIW